MPREKPIQDVDVFLKEKLQSPEFKTHSTREHVQAVLSEIIHHFETPPRFSSYSARLRTLFGT
jgi:hypothetical protein